MTENSKEPEKDVEGEKQKKTFSEKLDSLKNNESFETLINYSKKNTKDSIAYVLMFFGIVWMLFNSFYGGILVGLVTGFYFCKEVILIIKSYQQFVDEQGVGKGMIMVGTCIALFIAVPGIFIGAAIMIGIMEMLKVES